MSTQPPKNQKARDARNGIRRRLDQIAADAVEVLAQRIEEMKKAGNADPAELAKIIEQVMDVSLTISHNQRFAAAIAQNPSLAQHGAGGKLIKKFAGKAASIKKASKGDGREGAEKARREEESGPPEPPSWQEMQHALIQRGVLKQPQDTEPEEKPKERPVPPGASQPESKDTEPEEKDRLPGQVPKGGWPTVERQDEPQEDDKSGEGKGAQE